MRKLHKIIGLIMLLPCIAWAITGIFFFFKPGYQEAYQPLSIKFYQQTALATLPVNQAFSQVKQMQTILGQHVLVQDKSGWRHFLAEQTHPTAFKELKEPSEQQVKALITEAISAKPERYGNISSIDGLTATTDTEVRVTLNWQQLSLRQQGKDTDFINTIYNIHYLRWTGNKTIDQYLGVIGLLLIVSVAGIGTWMSFNRK